MRNVIFAVILNTRESMANACLRILNLMLYGGFIKLRKYELAIYNFKFILKIERNIDWKLGLAFNNIHCLICIN